MLTKHLGIRLGGLKHISRVVLLIVLIMTAILGYFVTKVEFDYDFETFFPTDDPETKFFEEHRHRFESDNDFIFIAFQRDEGVFDQVFLEKIESFTDSLRQDSLVEGVESLTHMKEYVNTFKRPFLHINEPEKYRKDSTRIFDHPELKGYFINEDATALMVYIKHQQFLSKAKCDEVKSSIDNLIAHYQFEKYVYGGRAIGINYYIHQMQDETVFFILLSFGLVIVFLIFTFKSFWGIWVPLTIVTFSMIWIVGFMGMVGQPINLILTVLPSIIFVVAMSDVIHLVSKYMEELRLGNTKEDAIRVAYREVGFATLLTSLTTSIGFLTLLTVNMEPVQNFGIYISIGVMLAFVLAYTLLPSILVLAKAPKISAKKITSNFWYISLHRTFLVLIKYKWKFFILSVVVFGIGLFGLSKVETNYFLLEDLKPSSSLRKDYDYFNKEFVGLRPFEMAVQAKGEDRKVTDYEVLKEIDKLETYLVNEYGLKNSRSIVSVVKLANRSKHGAQNRYYKLPDSTETTDILAQVRKYDSDDQLLLLVDSTEKYGRISSNIGDIGLYAIRDKNEELFKFIETNIDSNLVEFRMTGTGHLLDQNMSSLSGKLMIGLLIAVGAVSLLMGFLYRSFLIVLLAIVPNIFPMIMLSAILGFGGINLTVSTAIIFTISFGIAVDDTIHFMSKFKLELNKGKSVVYALKRTYLSTGRAIVLTTLILCSGFLLLMCSDFLGTFYIGFLISATLIFALIADLFLLPVLLLLFYKRL